MSEFESRNIKQAIRFNNIQLFGGVSGNNKRQARGKRR